MEECLSVVSFNCGLCGAQINYELQITTSSAKQITLNCVSVEAGRGEMGNVVC